MSDRRDPGWGAAFRAGFVPLRRARVLHDGTPPLLVLRSVWTAFAFSVVLISIVVGAVATQLPGGGPDGRVVAGVVVAIGVFAQLVAVSFVPPLSGVTPDEVQAAATRAVLLRIALAEAAALVGFLGFALAGNAAVYFAGALVSAVGMYDAMPGRRWIAQGQAQLRESGSSVDLLDALLDGRRG